MSVSPSAANTPRFDSDRARQSAGATFASSAEHYDQIRPRYPSALVDLLSSCHRIADIGAGTGIFSEQLRRAGHDVLALEPAAELAARLQSKLDIPVWRARAEATALAPASVDGASFAQSWHWIDPVAACAELDRIIIPGGKVLLAWNTIDVHAADWTLRLTRIMHSGDIHRPGFIPPFAAPWQLDTRSECQWTMSLPAGRLAEIMHTRSYWLEAGPTTRERMSANLNWYLYEHLGWQPDTIIDLPYRSDGIVLRRP